MPNHNKIILGITGEIASGKTTVANYLEKKYNAQGFKFSGVLRDILKRLYLADSRNNMQIISSALRENFTQDILSKTILQDIKKSKNKLIITEGIRRPSDIKYLQNFKNFYIIAINANAKIRYKRLTERSENPDDKNKTWQEFKQDSAREAELEIKNIAKQADFKINNNSSLQNLYKQINNIIKNL